jgi:hypothetical protein
MYWGRKYQKVCGLRAGCCAALLGEREKNSRELIS